MKSYCAECHSNDGNSTTDKAPRIAGFSALLIFDTLDQFQAGDRPTLIIKNKMQKKTSMQIIAKKLSEANAELIALYLAQQTFIPAPNPPLSQTLKEQGKQLHQDLCNDCHGKEGSSAADDAPILAGQWRNYLIRQFKQLSIHQRYAPKKMKRKFAKLSDLDKQALIAFYTQKAK